MNTSPVNPDRRTLPPGWNEHYDVSSQTWYYICTDYHPPRVSTAHPLGPCIIQHDDVPFICVPGPNFPVQTSTHFPAQLYASGNTKMQMFAPSPSLPAPNLPFLTPLPSTHLLDPHPVHVSQSYHPTSPRSHNRTTPKLSTKAEAPKEHKFTKSVSQLHTTAVPPPHTHPHVQVNTAAYLSPPDTTSMTASSASICPQQHVFLTPLSQSQGAYSTINHTRQQYQSASSAPQSTHVTPMPYAATQTAAQQMRAQTEAQYAVIAQAQAMLIIHQQRQLAHQQHQLALQQQMSVGMYGQQQRQNSLKNRLLDAFVRGAVGGTVGAVFGA